MMINNPLKKYTGHFSQTSLLDKVRSYFKEAGLKVIYSALHLYYAFKRKDTPLWAKNIIFGVLRYFIAPIDALPDLTPIIGYTDDLGVLSFGLVTIACYINTDVRNNAKGKLKDWFGEYDDTDLAEIDAQL